MSKNRRKKVNHLITNSSRTIRKSFPRFISLMLMSALGVFVFAGLTATAPDMIESLDRHLDGGHGYDVRVVSDLGLKDEDIDAIQKLSEIELAEGIHSGDVALTVHENQIVIRVASLTDKIYRPELVEGRMPEGEHEIVVETNLLTKEGLKIGDVLHFNSDTFYQEDITIVGSVNSALYYKCVENHQDHGKTNVGSGIINYYGYMSADAFDQDYYTAIYGLAVGAEALTTDSKEYKAASKQATDALDRISSEREQARYEEMKEEGQEKIEEAREKAYKKLDEAKEKLDDAKKELDDGKKKLEDGKKELEDSKKELEDGKKKIDDGENQISDGSRKIEDAKKKIPEAEAELNRQEQKLKDAKPKIEEGEKELAAARKLLDDAEEKLDAAQDQLDDAKDQLNEGKQELKSLSYQIENGKADLKSAKAQIEAGRNSLAAMKAKLKAKGLSSEVIAQMTMEDEAELSAQEAAYKAGAAEIERAEAAYEEGQKTLKSQQATYDKKKAQYENELPEYNKQKSAYDKAYSEFAPQKREYDNGVAEVEAGREELRRSKDELDSKVRELENARDELAKAKADYEEGQRKYADGQKTLEKNEKRYQKNLEKYKDSKAEYRKEKKKADRKIERAEKKLRDLKVANWSVYDREDDSTYKDYVQDSQSIANLALIFPVVFFLVAILVSLISMNRMVEDDRLEIGTLKSMGFSKRHIRFKYIMFSLIATIVGGIIGAVSGLYIIPVMIFNIYRVLFNVPGPVILVHPTTTLLGFLLAILCVSGTSIYTANKVLRERPSELMRPKAPKNGRKILLERIGSLWRHLSFSNKITVRNLFRYKKRVLITIGGIIGCTALMLTGFGIRDSIIDLPSRQYGDIFIYDGSVYLYDLEIGEEHARIAEIMDQPEIESYTAYQQLRFTCGDREGSIMAVENQASLEQIVNLRDFYTGEKLELLTDVNSKEVIISEKMADKLNLSIGDEFKCQDLDQNTFELKVGAICENYVDNYIYMDYRILDEVVPYAPNQACFKCMDMNQDEKDALVTRMLEYDEVLNVSYLETLVESVSNMLKSLNSVVLILVVLSAVLSFVVLYNLANININERKREIATLKVLGFFNNEVDRYITRENSIMTIVGIVFGLLAGTVLSHIVVTTIEVDNARFINEIKPLSYVYSAAFSVLFTWIVNKITHFALKKINMIDSLKSVE